MQTCQRVIHDWGQYVRLVAEFESAVLAAKLRGLEWPEVYADPKVVETFQAVPRWSVDYWKKQFRTLVQNAYWRGVRRLAADT